MNLSAFWEANKIKSFLLKNMSMEKYKQAWGKFQTKMTDLKRRRHDILKHISEKLDKQHIEALRKKIENHE